MSLIPSNVLGASGQPQGYLLQRSLRFRASASAYLNRTPASAGNRKTWTWSGWVKRGSLGSVQFIENPYSDLSNYDRLWFTGSDTLEFDAFNAGATNISLVTTQVFRDSSAWYHIILSIDTTQATSANRAKLYVNGVQVTAFSTATYPAQNADTWFNATVVHNIARSPISGGVYYFDGYLAEVNFIDGQALTPSSFGYTNSYGVWQPTRYTGTYGTNGFYLPFSDNTSATTLAYDKSGNGNNWTPNNISTTAGATYDSMTDVPTLTSATAANYCVLNPLQKGSQTVFSNANLTISIGSAGFGKAVGSIGMTTGKWYCEYSTAAASGYEMVGLAKDPYTDTYPGADAYSWSYISGTGNKWTNGSGTAYGATWTSNDIIGIAFDADAGTLTFYKNGTSQGTAFTGLTSGPYYFTFGDGNTASVTVGNVTFGQRPFSYTPPTGFKALNTFNLPDPVIKKPNQYMDATTFTGTGGNTSVTNAGAFQPDLVWAKGRSTAQNNWLVDSVRGANNVLFSNLTNAEGVGTGVITAFNSNGFNIDASFTNAATYVGWQWKKGATPGFDIVTYTATASAQNVAHSLGVAPAMFIYKNRTVGTAGYDWIVYHKSIGANNAVLLNSTSAQQANIGFFNNTAPTSSVFSVGTAVSNSGNAMVAYLFAEIAGFSKFGSYTGNGSADGPFVYCGFRPKYVLIKSSSVATTDWYVQDATVNPSNVVTNYLYPNLSSAEQTNGLIDFTSNGFKIRNNYAPENQNGATYIYAAFAQNPLKYSLAR